MKKTNLLLSFALTFTLAHSVQAEQFELAQTPIFVNSAVPPLNMLVMGRDHKLYFEAYNDASDLDGNGALDIGYKGYLPTGQGGIDYFGYFNSYLCYKYNGSTPANGTNNTGYFYATKKTINKQCDGSSWSGDYLNYLATSRMDALRKVFYGGYRATDTATQTILQGAYIPRDAHSWGKELNRGDFDITKFTPLPQPGSGKRHLLSVTSISDNGIPKIQVAKNTSQRIWDWVSKERPVAINNWCSNSKECSIAETYNIRVEACPSGANLQFENDSECKTYPNNGKPIIKPVGILHDFGETDRMYFGLLTGSYEKNIAGGILRSNMNSFSREIDPITGQFCLVTGACKGIRDSITDGIVHNINNLRLIGFDYGDNSYKECPWIPNREMNATDKCYMWGNPIGEMMYETLRYFAGARGPTSTYNYGAKSKDEGLGLTKPTWSAPYQEGNYASCSVPAMTVISDINPSFDYKLPGSSWNSISNDVLSPSLNVSKETNKIGELEGISGNYFIGQSTTGNYDAAPSSKPISTLATVRGLAPEEPTRQGTYYSAGVARYGANNAIGGSSKLYTYAVALASPLPKFEFKIGGSTITLVPFAKTVGGGFSSYTIDRNSSFRPTNSIADFYVDEYVNMGKIEDPNINGGRPRIKFRVNFEDQEQGADFDMDRLVTYTIEQINDAGEIRVTVESGYPEEDTWVQNVGYVISGTKGDDGVYLELCLSDGKCTNRNDSYFALNTPLDEKPGFCATNNPSNKCWALPRNQATRTFTPGTTSGAELLNDPLWYAAKYGIPGRDPKTVKNDPDNYFLVTNALTLREQLSKAFNDILQKNASVTAPVVDLAPQGASTSRDRDVYSTKFDVETWTGRLIKETLNQETNKLEPAWEASVSPGRRVTMANADHNRLQDFTWDNLRNRTHAGTNLRQALNQNDGLGEKRVAFIKGGEGDPSFRNRESLLGDIVNSNPVLVAGAQYLPYLADQIDGVNKYRAFVESQSTKAPMVYVGANDGMLHGFNAKTGAATFSFIPTPVIENLHTLTDPAYVNKVDDVNKSLHQYYVDGSISVGDVYIDGNWRTVLVGTLGAGGRGAYALDVTDPGNITLLWEFTVDHSSSKANPTDPTAKSDLGHVFGTPVIARLHNGKWGVLLNNGYNSPNASTGNATLFVLDIATGNLTYKLTANAAAGYNGLSAVKAADNNGDGIADYAYAGDLQGNLWRFDLFNRATAQGSDPFLKTAVDAGAKVSYGGKPLFQAKTPVGNRVQPITVEPSLIRHPTSVGYIVSFGTGRYLADTDKVGPYTMQSVYGIWDENTRGEAQPQTITTPLTRANLRTQTFTRQSVESIGDDGKKVSQTVRLISQNEPNWASSNCQATAGTHCGWVLDLGLNGATTGERMVDSMIASGEVLFFSTRQPIDDPCASGLEGWTYGINPATGGRTNFTVFDLNRNETVGIEDNLWINGASHVVSGFKTAPGGFALADNRLINAGGDSDSDSDSDSVNIGGMLTSLGPSAQGRQSWYIVPVDQAE